MEVESRSAQSRAYGSGVRSKIMPLDSACAIAAIVSTFASPVYRPSMALTTVMKSRLTADIAPAVPTTDLTNPATSRPITTSGKSQKRRQHQHGRAVSRPRLSARTACCARAEGREMMNAVRDARRGRALL